MKLRIKGNSLRIRIGRSELQRLVRERRIEDSIQFTADPDARFTYVLEISDAGVEQTGVLYSPHRLAVSLTREQAGLWNREEEVSVHARVPIGEGNFLDVLVEKDFACLDRGEEENQDAFANPHAGKDCQVA